MDITPATSQDLENHAEDILSMDTDPDYEPIDEDSYRELAVRWIRTFVDNKTAERFAHNPRWEWDN